MLEHAGWLRFESNPPTCPLAPRPSTGCRALTVTSCVAVDENGSGLLLWRSGRWSTPQPVGAGGTLTSVSCPTTTYCLASSAGGSSVTYDGQSWSPPVSIGPEGTYRVSCPTVTFCAAAGAGGTVGSAIAVGTFDGRSWSTLEIPGSGALDNRVLDVSCATPKFCVVVNLDGHASTFDGQRWSSAPGTGPQGMISVSCPSTPFCLAVTTSGAYVTYDGKSWSAPSAIPGFGAAFAYAVSCVSTTRCTVIGLSGMAVNWQGGRWSKPVRVLPLAAPRPRWRSPVLHPARARPSIVWATPQHTDYQPRAVSEHRVWVNHQG